MPTTLTPNECEQAVAAMSAPQRLRFLATLSHHLTVVARATYDVSGPGVQAPLELRAFNELQHRLSAEIRNLAIDGKATFSASDLTALITGSDRDAAFQHACVQACEWALENVAPA